MKVATPIPQSCDPARKTSKADYQAGFTNQRVAAAWGRSPSLVSHKWEPFCDALLAVYRALGRRRLQEWLSALSTQHSALSTVSDDELGMIWRRSEGFVRQHKRRPFEANMTALHGLDPAGFWLLISELDFRERLVKRET